KQRPLLDVPNRQSAFPGAAIWKRALAFNRPFGRGWWRDCVTKPRRLCHTGLLMRTQDSIVSEGTP
ncbi:MAG: hypothetical protein WB679_21760, partial [Terracidiphilus sp.]